MVGGQDCEPPRIEAASTVALHPIPMGISGEEEEEEEEL
jgi:hypothetical protein